MVKGLNSLLFLVLLSGCSLHKHYKKVATDTNVTTEKKAIIAPWVSINFPVRVETVTKVDSFETVIYDEAALIEMNAIIDSLLLNRDTAVKWIKQNCVPRVEKKTITIRDTVFQSNGAQVFALQNQIANLQQETLTKTKAITSLEEKISKAKTTRNYLLGVIALFVFGLIVFILAKLKVW